MSGGAYGYWENLDVLAAVVLYGVPIGPTKKGYGVPVVNYNGDIVFKVSRKDEAYYQVLSPGTRNVSP